MAVNWMNILHAAWRRRGLVASAVGAALVMVILVPLPSSLMDLLLLANIGLSVVILLTALQVRSPLEFSVLPSVLLGATLLRLVLNVATTRLILTAGSGATSASMAQFAAGKVVWTFSSFVTHGSLAVGAILFAILIVIQFLVVTKGATRISEVAARFVLDAMPGKQMAIDADLANKAIDAVEARRRREQIVQEADFYGAMDGASKFMRGDALAALAIVLVNLVGGICVGTMQNGWDLGATVNLFTRLTLGEGLVMQIPAFLVSVAAALLITRSTRQMDFAGTVASQLFMRPPVLISTAVFLGLLALTPLPTLPLLVMGGSCIGLASMLSRREQAQPEADSAPTGIQPVLPAATPSKGLTDLMSVDQLQLEIGYAMVRLLGPQAKAAADAGPQGDLLEQIAAVRRQMAAEVGLLVPPIRIRDNMDLQAHTYVLKLRGVKVAQGRCYPNQLLALAEGKVTGSLEGRPWDEPGLGGAGTWILPDQRQSAAQMGYRVIDPAQAVGLHMAHVLRRHGAELLSRQQVAGLLDALAARSPALVAEVRERFKLSAVQKVLQNLLRERVPVHDLEGILEAMSDWPGDGDELWAITEHVRSQLAAALSQQYASLDGKLRCVALAPELEQQIARHLQPTAAGDALAMDPQMSGRISRQLCDAIGKLRSHGHRGVVLCSPAVRSAVRQLVAVRTDAAVLAYSEVESVDVQTLECVGLQT